MAVHRNHGGLCCGMSHIHGFARADFTDEAFERLLRNIRRTRTKSMVTEIVLTNRQMTEIPTSGEVLYRHGFRLVNRFTNPNSDNICNVFHRNPFPKELKGRLPAGLRAYVNAERAEKEVHG